LGGKEKRRREGKGGEEREKEREMQKFTNFLAIRSWNFRIFAMRWWPRFLRHPVQSRCSAVHWTAAVVATHNI